MKKRKPFNHFKWIRLHENDRGNIRKGIKHVKAVYPHHVNRADDVWSYCFDDGSCDPCVAYTANPRHRVSDAPVMLLTKKGPVKFCWHALRTSFADAIEAIPMEWMCPRMRRKFG